MTPVSAHRLNRGLGIIERALGPDHPDLVSVLINIGMNATRRGDDLRAIESYERALTIRENHGGDPTNVAEIQFRLARALWPSPNDQQRAADLARQALETLENAGPTRSKDRAEIAEWLRTR